MFFGNLSLFASYAMLITPKKPKQLPMFSGNQAQYEIKPATKVALVPILVALS